MLWQVHRQGWRLVTFFAATLEGETHCVRVRYIALERFGDGCLQLRRSVAGQQLHQGGRNRSQIIATLRSLEDERLAGGGGTREIVSSAVTPGALLMLDQG